MVTTSLPQAIDIGIIGAGPQALTLMLHLLHKRPKFRHKVLVFDPSGTWLQQWRHQFAAQDILHLRSPAVHHPAPNPYELRKFAENRPQELFEPYSLPSTQLFDDFCHYLTQKYQLTAQVYPAQVNQIIPDSSRFQLILANGQSIIARRVILATGGGKPNFPNWVKQIQGNYPKDRVIHSSQVDLRFLNLQGERILMIGGGLSSGHLALGGVTRGAKIDLMVRRRLQAKLFDAEPGWLGPKYLKGFMAEESWEKRWQMIQDARNGGSMTPEVLLKLRRLSRDAQLTLIEECEVSEALWQEENWQVTCKNGEKYYYDRVWLATGTQLNGENHPLLADIKKYYGIQWVKGLPVLDSYLRIPKSELFIMGALAGLQLGPTARNLSGGIRGSQQIVEALIKPSLAQSLNFLKTVS